MDCNVFLEAFEKNFDIALTDEEKQQFCMWVEETAGTGNLNVRSLLTSSPEGLSSKFEDMEKLREQERRAIQDALEILIDAYLGKGLVD